MSSRHYTYRAEWSAEDDEYVGLVAEFPSLSWLADTAAEAVAGVSRLVDEILDDMATTGETPPVPLSERRYSGNIALRTSSEQHRRLAIEAAEQGVSLNQWVIYKLSSASAHGTLVQLADAVTIPHSAPKVAPVNVVRGLQPIGPGIGGIGRVVDLVLLADPESIQTVRGFIDDKGLFQAADTPPDVEGVPFSDHDHHYSPNG